MSSTDQHGLRAILCHDAMRATGDYKPQPRPTKTPQKKGGGETDCSVEVSAGPFGAYFVGPAQPTTGLERLRDVQGFLAVGSGLDV